MASDTPNQGAKRKRDDDVDEQQPVKKPTRSNFNQTINVVLHEKDNSYVGELKCHKDIVEDRGVQVTNEKELRIVLDIDLDILKLYLEYIYSLETTDLVKTAGGLRETEETSTIISTLTDAWLLGEKLKDDIFQDAAMDALLRQQPEDLELEEIVDLWCNCPSDSALQRWCTDTIVHSLDEDTISYMTNWEMVELLGAVAIRLLRGRGTMPTIEDLEKYRVANNKGGERKDDLN